MFASSVRFLEAVSNLIRIKDFKIIVDKSAKAFSSDKNYNNCTCMPKCLHFLSHALQKHFNRTIDFEIIAAFCRNILKAQAIKFI